MALPALVISTRPVLAVATIAAMLLPTTIATLYSYRFARRR
ncbi:MULTISPECIES: hypothetical protein [unclassified Ensifer]|nr:MULTISPECIES: hypothetical protein [unclassified Ensifer]